MSTAALAKVGVKARSRNNKKHDFAKLRVDLRQRCKLRMREQRVEILNQKRFGVVTDDAVENKIKEIFHAELEELTTTKEYDVPARTPHIIKKLIDNAEPAVPLTEEEKQIFEEYHKLKEEETSKLMQEES